MNRSLAFVLAFTWLGCGDGGSGAAASASASATAARSGAPVPSSKSGGWCAALGGTGEGSLASNCAVKTAPFEITVLDRYADGIDGRLCSLKNTSKEDFTFGGVKGFYYDKAGKLLAVQPTNRTSPTELFSHSGSDFAVKAGQTIEYECGWQRTDEPAGSTLEVEVYQWGIDEPSERYFTRDLGGKSWENRPKGGF